MHDRQRAVHDQHVFLLQDGSMCIFKLDSTIPCLCSLLAVYCYQANSVYCTQKALHTVFDREILLELATDGVT